MPSDAIYLPDEDGDVIFRMTITLPDGRKIRRANGRPFRIVLRSKKKR